MMNQKEELFKAALLGKDYTWNRIGQMAQGVCGDVDLKDNELNATYHALLDYYIDNYIRTSKFK